MDLFKLSATLGLNTSEYDKKLKDADGKGAQFAQKLARGMSTTAKVAAAGMATIAAGAALAGQALWGMAQDAALAGDRVDKLSQKLGLSRKAFQEWDYILSQNGASIDSMRVGMNTLQKTMEGLTEDGEKSADAFRAIGLDIEAVKQMSPEQAFEATVKALQDLPEGAGKTASALKLFGRQGAELMPMLNQTAAGTEELRQRAHELGMVMGDEFVDNSVEMGDTLDDLKGQVNALKNTIAGGLMPGITQGARALIGVLKGDAGAGDALAESVEALTDSASSVAGSLINKGMKIMDALGEGIMKALPKVAQKLGQAGPQIIKGIAKAGPQVVKAGMNIIGEMAKGIVQSLPELIPALMEGIGELGEAIVGGLHDLLSGMLMGLLRTVGVFSVDLDTAIGEAFRRVDKRRAAEISTKITTKAEQTSEIRVATKVTHTGDDLQTQVDKIYQGVTDKLAAGKEVTQEDADKVNEAMNKYVNSELNKVDIDVAAEMKRLKDDLDAGMIDETQYKKRLDALLTNAEVSKVELEALRTSSQSYVTGLVGDSSATAEKVTQDLDNMTSAAKTAADTLAALTPSATSAGTALHKQISNIYQGAIDKLKEGKPVTQGDADAINKAANKVIDDGLASIEINTKARSEQLKADLDAGLIDETEYKNRMDALLTQAEASKVEMEALRASSQAYANGLAGDSSATADEVKNHLASMTEGVTAAVNTVNGLSGQIQIQSLYKQIESALTDGMPDTPEEKEALTKKITSTFEEQRIALQNSINAEIAKLDINDADYAAKMDTIKTKGAEMTAELNRLELETVGFLNEQSGKSTAAVKAHMGELDEVERRAQAVTAKIDAARQAQQEQQDTDLRLVTGGKTKDEGTITNALGGLKGRLQAEQEEAERLYEEQLKAYKDMAAKKEITDDEYQALEGAAAAEMEGRMDHLAAEYKANLEAALKGVAKAFEGETGAEREAIEGMDLAEQMNGVIEKLAQGTFKPEDLTGEMLEKISEAYGPEFAVGFQQQIKQALQLNGDFNDPSMLGEVQATIGSVAEKLKEAGQAAIQSGNYDFGKLGELFQGAIDSGILDGIKGLDLTDQETKMRAMMGDLGKNSAAELTAGISGEKENAKTAGTDLSDSAVSGTDGMPKDMETSGTNGAQGLIDGMNKKLQDAYNKGKQLAEKAVEGVDDGLETASPSKKLRRRGVYAGEGFVLGVQDMLAKAHRAMQEMVSPESLETALNGGEVRARMEVALRSPEKKNEQKDGLYQLAEALRQHPTILRVGARDVAEATMTETSRTQSQRSKRIVLGMGG